MASKRKHPNDALREHMTAFIRENGDGVEGLLRVVKGAIEEADPEDETADLVGDIIVSLQ